MEQRKKIKKQPTLLGWRGGLKRKPYLLITISDDDELTCNAASPKPGRIGVQLNKRRVLEDERAAQINHCLMVKRINRDVLLNGNSDQPLLIAGPDNDFWSPTRGQHADGNMMKSCDLCGSTGYRLHLIHCRIKFESSGIPRFIMDVQNQVERIKTGNICINRVGTPPR